MHQARSDLPRPIHGGDHLVSVSSCFPKLKRKQVACNGAACLSSFLGDVTKLFALSGVKLGSNGTYSRIICVLLTSSDIS
jgi:hypothetical protein